VGPGALVGELSCIDGGPSAERAGAVTPVLALRLRREPLMALMVDVPAFTIALSQLLAVRVRSLQSELAERPDAESDQARPTPERRNGPS
jgi:CRP-like cAMP-binding protein